MKWWLYRIALVVVGLGIISLPVIAYHTSTEVEITEVVPQQDGSKVFVTKEHGEFTNPSSEEWVHIKKGPARILSYERSDGKRQILIIFQD